MINFFVNGSWFNPCAKPTKIFHNGVWKTIGTGTKYFLNGQWKTINCNSSFKWVVDTSANYCEQNNGEDIPDNTFIDIIADNPQTGNTNKWKFKISTTEPITTSITVGISGFYDNPNGVGVTAFNHLINLPANELEYVDENWIVLSSPAGGLSNVTMAFSTPFNGTNVISSADGRVFPLKIIINNG